MTTEAGYVAAWASGPHLHDKDLDLTIDAAHVLRHDSLRLSRTLRLGLRRDSLCGRHASWLEDMLGRAADEIPRHWVVVTTTDEPH